MRARSASLIRISSRSAPVSGSTARCTIELNCLPRRVETKKRSAGERAARAARRARSGRGRRPWRSGRRRRDGVRPTARRRPGATARRCRRRAARRDRSRAGSPRRPRARRDAARSGKRARHHLAEHPPLRLRGSDAPARDLGREDDAPLGRRLGAAARRFVARRRRQQQHVAGALDQHRRRQHDVLVDAQARPRQRALGLAPCPAASRASCRRPSRTCRPRRPRSRSIASVAVHPGCAGTSKPHTSAQRARVSRRHAGHAADLGAALHARVAADRHQAAAGSRRQAAGEAEVDQRLHGVDAVRVLRQAHRPHEHRLRPIDQQARERLDAGARHAALALDRVPRRRRRRRASTSAAPVVCASTKARSTPPQHRHAFSTPTRKARSPPVCTSNPVVGDARCRRSRCWRSTGSSSASGRARDTG